MFVTNILAVAYWVKLPRFCFVCLLCILQHLAGHYGGAWQLQKIEFPTFPGPILVTTNCVIEPMRSYKNRLFTSNETGWPGCQHVILPDDAHKLVDAALSEPGFSEEDCKPGEAPGSSKALTVGFGHNTILSNADTVNSNCFCSNFTLTVTGIILLLL